ncbi:MULTISPECIES: hypothetical protein [unclassified Halomonas]|nr:MULTISPECIES: hypothetical protein [unclassified Halomonas]MDT0501130.1 hypothetical protein [Halomonas sp. PAR7]MDT0513321.1 hypothetical protein [Halomonas sp. LES1]MDT0592166.1 hypothetical protein [Halomonas sp. PAR8]
MDAGRVAGIWAEQASLAAGLGDPEALVSADRRGDAPAYTLGHE